MSGSGRVRTPKQDKDLIRRYRITAILLALTAILMLIALLSYTTHDEANAQLTLRDMIGVIRGDEDLRVRFETTHNWLGLLGAVLAHWMYTSTIGVWSICIPVLMLFWARALFTHQRLGPLLTRRSIATIGTATLLSAFVGTLQLVPWMFTIDREWAGAIGQFIAGVISQFIGTAGSAVVLLAALAFASVIGFEINVGTLGVRARLLVSAMKDRLARMRSANTNEAGDDDDDLAPTDDETMTAPANDRDDHDFIKVDKSAGAAVLKPLGTDAKPSRQRNDEEPAEIIRRNVGPQAGTPLAPSVRIVRPLPKPPATPPPVDDAVEEPLEQDDTAGITPSAEQPEQLNALDMDLVQRRLSALHPNKSISVQPPSTEAEEDDATDEYEHGDDEPIVEEDDAEYVEDQQEAENEEEPEEQQAPAPALPQRERIQVQRPLTVMVEQSAGKEPEVVMPGNALYDEEIRFQPPTIALLVQTDESSDVDDTELQENARILQEKLETFRIRIENLTVQPGPVVTQYEFVPAAGIKVSQIESLADDIALALKAQGVRIIAPIPGRGTVGIEIPNHKPAIVRFSSIIKSPKYHNPDIKLPIAMGKTVVGEVYCADLTKMPHLLIAGATGKGKSVGINTIIASLLYKMHPRDLKFVIIDPKRVEMNLYASLKHHFMAVSPDIDETIITSPQNAVAVLKSVVEEMQQRFSLLAAAGQRNINDYNSRVKDGKLTDKGGITHRPMPYIVVIIDELADLMMTAGKEVEEPICRLAQLARAVGIHCIVATQRPSVDVVTGLIKANFPARIAYQVSSRIDSRTIIDGSGAEHLIGNGDMLFAPGNTPKPIRMQNAFISTEEVEELCDWIGRQKGYSTPYMLPSISNKRGGGHGSDGGDRDVLFEDAARIFIQLQQASVSTLQRRLKVGYARAARIVDELEMAGIVGPPDGAKGRQVLLDSEAELEAYL